MMSAMRGLFGLFFMSVVVVAAGCRSERYPAVVSGLEPLTESEVGSTEGEASPVAPEDLTVPRNVPPDLQNLTHATE